MKLKAIIILVAAASLVAGVAYRVQRTVPNPPAPGESLPTAEPAHEISASIPVAASVPTPRIEAAPEKQDTTPSALAALHPEKPPVVAAPPATPPAERYWDQAARFFARHTATLDQETDPARRLALIRAVAGYVRVDTPTTIDWAMALENPDERRAALESINQNALSGIGAQIEVDETGFPRIKETTVLSAIASTGQVQNGDYIVGMLDGSGQPLYFKGVPLQQVVQVLRGQPGSEIQLIMERVPAEGGMPIAFNVAVTRSMLVVQPPY